jgi:hypothetical protein
MKPEQPHAPDHELDDADPGSTVRAKRRRVDPRLDEIADAARRGELTETQALEAMARVLGEVVGRFTPRATAMGIEAGLKELAKDPAVLAKIRGEEE